MASSTSEPNAGQGKAITPPKGRPTRGRGDVDVERRVFGPTAQWVTLGVLIIAIVIVLIMVTGGGEFGPLHGGNSGSLVLAPVAGLLTG